MKQRDQDGHVHARHSHSVAESRHREGVFRLVGELVAVAGDERPQEGCRLTGEQRVDAPLEPQPQLHGEAGGTRDGT